MSRALPAALALALALGAGPARAADQEASIPALAPLPAGLGQSAAAPSLPGAPSSTALPPSLPASAIPRAPSAAVPGASGAAVSASASSGLAAHPAAAPEARGRAVAEAASPLERAGLSKEAAAALGELASDPTLFPAPASGEAFHDAKLARTLALLAAEQARGEPPRRRAALAAAALLSTLDPARPAGTLPRPGANAEFLKSDPRVRALLQKLAALPSVGEPPLEPEEVLSLAREAQVGPGDERGSSWGARLRFLREAAPYLGQTIDAQRALDRLAAEQRATASAELGHAVTMPTDAAVAAGAFSQLAVLRESPFFAELPQDARSRFGSTLAVLELFRDDAPQREAAAPPGPRGLIRVLGGREQKTLRVAFERRPARLNATFMVEDDAGRKLALKTARYVGVEPGNDERARLSKEAGYTRLAEELAARPGFPKNVKIVRWLSFAEMPPELSQRVYGERGVVPAMLLARAPGRTLQEHMASGGTLDPRAFAGLVEAYRQLHAAGFLHGDPNAGNILIDESGGEQTFTLLDFNASKRRSEVDAGAWRSYVAEEDASVRALADLFR